MIQTHLSDFLPLKETLQHHAQAGRTGCFEVRMNDLVGRIYLTDGTITHAQTDDEEGKDALFRILGWTGCQYRWENDPSVMPEATMADAVQDMLIEFVFWENEKASVGPGPGRRDVPQSISTRTTRNLFRPEAQHTMLLHVRSEEIKPMTFQVACNQVRVGRASSNDLVLLDSSVSRRHAALLVTGASLLVRDLGSKNGTFINDRPVVQGILREGSLLRLGEVECRLELGQTAGPAGITEDGSDPR